MSEQPFTASGSFLDAKSQSMGGAGNTTSDILFLKRLLFIKASLDNEQSLSNFAVPFDEDKAFQLRPGETRPQLDPVRPSHPQTAPHGARRDRLSQPPRDVPFQLEDDDEKPLALTNGGHMDALDTSDAQMKALFDRSGEQKAPPRTAGAKVRPNNKRSAVPKHNSLNLHAAKSHGSQKQMQAADKQN